MIVGAGATLAAVASELVFTVQFAAAGAPAAPLVTPWIWTVAPVLIGRAQVPPLSASVIVTVVTAPVAEETEHFAKPFVSSTVGLAGTVKTDVAFGKAIVIVSPAASAPVLVDVKPTVQVDLAVAASVGAANVTDAGVVAAAITTAAPGLTALVLSTDVWMLNVFAA